MTVPQYDDYPHCLVSDGRLGEERRVTIDGIPLEVAMARAEPLVSIITIVYNNARHIERAMQSIFAQSYRNIEYLVIDAGSVDGTVDVISKYADRLSYWHSAPDKGIADGFNTGVALARGRFIGLVNSDDWMSPDQVERGIEALNRTGAPFVFGDLVYHRPSDGKAMYHLRGDPKYARKLWSKMSFVNHPTALVRRDVYRQCGLFSLKWRICMDYDWLVRLQRAGVIGIYCSEIVGHMSLGGVSDTRWVECLQESEAIALRYGGPRYVIKAMYLFRRCKVRLRQKMEAFLPHFLSFRVRRLLNPSLSRASDS